MKCQEYESHDDDVTESHDVTAEEVFKHVDILEEVEADSSRVGMHVSDQFLECILDDEPEHSGLDPVLVSHNFELDNATTKHHTGQQKLDFTGRDSRKSSTRLSVDAPKFVNPHLPAHELSKHEKLIQDQTRPQLVERAQPLACRIKEQPWKPQPELAHPDLTGHQLTKQINIKVQRSAKQPVYIIPEQSNAVLSE